MNPKLSVFFFAFLPQFVDAQGRDGITLPMLGLGVAFDLVTGVTMLGYVFAASAVRRSVIGRPDVMKWFGRAVVASFVVLAGRLAIAQR